MRVGMFTYGMGRHLTGIGRYTQELCAALTRLDAKLELILINPYQHHVQPFFREFENYHVPVLQKLPAVLGLGPALLPTISRKLALDIFHDPCGISPFLLPRQQREARRVVTVHDAVPYVFPQVQPLLTRLTFRTFIPAARRNVDAILTVSESSRHDLIRYVGFSPDKVHVVYQGVFTPSKGKIQKHKRDVTTLKKWNISSPYFLYVGALNPRKNVPTLISAFHKVIQRRSDVKLVLVGPKTWLADETLRTAKRFEESVVLTGYVDESELGVLYAHAAALVYPSIYEGFGLPPLEAMAYGTPVVTSNVSSLPEVVGDAGLLVEPMDVEALATAMMKTLDPTISTALSDKGRRRSQMFRWENTAQATFRVYESVLR